MIDNGTIRSTVRPEETEVDEYSVYVNTDIHEVTVSHEDDTHTEYEYHQMIYSKDEMINKLIDQNKQNNELMDTILGVNE